MIERLIKIKWYYIVTFLLVTLSNVYITSISSLSPAYIGILLSPVSIFLFCNTEKIKWNSHTLELFLLSFCFFVYLIIDCIITGNSDEKNYYLNYFFYNHFIFIISVFFIQRCDINQIKKIIKWFFIFSSFIFIVDFIWRVNHSITKFSGLLAFYNFKFNDLMFLDSNWPGFMSMLLFSLLMYLLDNNYIKNKFWLWIAFFIVILSLSRAALACCILVLMFSRYLTFKKSTRFYIVFLGIPLIVFSILILLTKLTDASFLSKLELLNGMYYYITHFDLGTILIGNYPDACHENQIFMNTWIGGHLYMTRYIDFGFISCAFEVFFLFLICIYTNFKALYLIIPFFIAGLSFCPWNVPYFYMELALIYILENKLYKERNGNLDYFYNLKKDLSYIFTIK